MAKVSDNERYPVEVSNISKEGEVEVVNNNVKLICYRDPVPGTTKFNYPFYYASVYDLLNPKTAIDQSIRQYVVLRRKPLQDAYDTFNFLSLCEHPNILKPYGFWEDNDNKGFIAFPRVKGTLGNLPTDELFSVEIDANKVTWLKGFSPSGMQIIRDIVSSVHYVNERYPQAGTSSSGSAIPPLTMFPLELASHKILYEKIPTGEYKIFLGDISTTNHWPKTMKKIEDLKRHNWNCLGKYISTIMVGHKPNTELIHLVDVLIKDCITKLGLNYNEAKSLLSSVMLLRNKIVAHQDDPYQNYTGPKEQIGVAKALLEKLVLDSKPAYMIKLIEEIRKLNWIGESPLVRSLTSYVKAFDPNLKIRTS
uniref:Protein kinase domain-containing protein n=1 Tax=Oryza nivara TaxID=4536 RepID=A0A0E0J2E9_ORYNI